MKLRKVKRKGRPKGRDLTVIGLPKRQKRDGPVKFLHKLPLERELGTILVRVHSVISKILISQWHVVTGPPYDIYSLFTAKLLSFILTTVL